MLAFQSLVIGFLGPFNQLMCVILLQFLTGESVNGTGI